MEKLSPEFARKDLNTIEFMLKNMPTQIGEDW